MRYQLLAFKKRNTAEGHLDTYVECTDDRWDHLCHLHYADMSANTGEIALSKLEHSSVHLFYVLVIA